MTTRSWFSGTKYAIGQGSFLLPVRLGVPCRNLSSSASYPHFYSSALLSREICAECGVVGRDALAPDEGIRAACSEKKKKSLPPYRFSNRLTMENGLTVLELLTKIRYS